MDTGGESSTGDPDTTQLPSAESVPFGPASAASQSEEIIMGSSTFLFARPSFFEGAARLVDWSGGLNFYAMWDEPAEADEAAMAADWSAVHDDLAEAVSKT